MYSVLLLLGLFAAALVFGIVEYIRHQRKIYSIPIRIHINGTRGKSSVTRLVGAGLRAGGINAITKVTGTNPRLILSDGSESIVHRRGEANIIEQKSIVKYAARKKSEAIVIECMALDPSYQWITENQMIHATIGVITNIRPDHLDVMGPTVKDVAKALGKTIPKNGVLFTSDTENISLLQEMADKKHSKLYLATASDVTNTEMNGFSYIEHHENVSLALAICSHLGIDRSLALEAMYKAIPDDGVLRAHKIQLQDRRIIFYNALAANDPLSSLMIWRKLQSENLLEGFRCIILNTRHDRVDRARQLTEMIGNELADFADMVFLVGNNGRQVEAMLIKNGFPSDKINILELNSPEKIFNKILLNLPEKTTIVAFGNMGGIGAPLSEYFENRSSFFSPAGMGTNTDDGNISSY